MTSELLSLVLTLRPAGSAPAAQPAPTWWGRAAHALLLNIVRQADPALANTLHDDHQPRPFTVSSLLGRFATGWPDPTHTYSLRFTALEARLTDLLAQAARAGPLAAGRVVELDYLPFQVESAGLTDPAAGPPPNPWLALTSYAELSAPLLLAKTPAPRQVTLQFTSPTTFKSGGKHLPVPLPELVFGSLLERWNEFAPIAFPAEARRYAAECLALSRYRLSTRAAPLKAGGLRVGAVGQAAYTSLNYDRYWMSVIGVLSAFALFAGVGAGTSMGLGQCRMVE